MKMKFLIFALGVGTWFMLNWTFTIEQVCIGITISALVAFLTGDVFSRETKVFQRAGRYIWIFYYVPLFIWECIKANLDGAYRVLHPKLPMNPGIVKVKTTLTSDAGLTFLANSLTLKPGTMTVDIDRQNGFLYVHWVDVKSQDVQKATELIVQRFERVLKRIFE